MAKQGKLDARRDEVLKRLLQTPPRLHKDEPSRRPTARGGAKKIPKKA